MMRTSLVALAVGVTFSLDPAAAQLSSDLERKVELLADTTLRLCGLGLQITYEGGAGGAAILGLKIPGAKGTLRGTRSEIPALLSGLVPESSQASQTRDCAKPFLERIFSIVERGDGLPQGVAVQPSPEVVRARGAGSAFYLGVIDRDGLTVTNALRSKDGPQSYLLDIDRTTTILVRVAKITARVEARFVDAESQDLYDDDVANPGHPIEMEHIVTQGSYMLKLTVEKDRATGYEMTVHAK